MRSPSAAADVYDGHRGWGKAPSESQRQRIAQTLALIPDGVSNVLDAGCGDGTLSNRLAERGIEVVGVDISSVALSHIEAKRVVGSVGQLPFRDSAFDLVLCTEVLEHLPVDVYPQALGELERVASRHILVTTPCEEYLPGGFVRCGHCGCVYHRGHHVRAFSREDHRRLFQRFEAVQTAEIGQRTCRPLAIRLRQCLLGLYRKRGLMCPCCRGGEPAVPTVAGFRKLVGKAIGLLGKLTRPRRTARWLATLYRATAQPPEEQQEGDARGALP